jgi:hypothetical protein
MDDTVDDDPLDEHPGPRLEVDTIAARNLFDKIDTDNDGILTLAEVIAVARDTYSDEGKLLHALLQLPDEASKDDGTLEIIVKHFSEMDVNYKNGVNFDEFIEYITSHLFLNSLSNRLKIVLLKQQEERKKHSEIQKQIDWAIHIPAHVCVTDTYRLWVPLDRAVQVLTSMLYFLSEEDAIDVLRLMEKSACFLTTSGRMDAPDATHSVVRFAMRQFMKVCLQRYFSFIHCVR